MADGIKVLVVDDHMLVRHGIKAILEAEKGFSVVGEAENGREAVSKAAELAPDVVLMDIAMPILNGVEATRQIKSALPRVNVIALSMYSDEEYIFQVLKAGASGYLLKDTSGPDLISAVRSVYGGSPFFSPLVSRKIMDSYLNEDPDNKAGTGTDRLTSREKETLQLIAEGYTNNEAGKLMKISVKTVATHRAHIMAKLGIHDVAGLIKYAIKKGLVVLDK